MPTADILICQNLYQVMELGNILQQTDNPDQDNMYKEVTTHQVVVGDQLQVEQEVEVKVDLQVDRMEEVMDQDLEDPMEVEMAITEIIGAHLD